MTKTVPVYDGYFADPFVWAANGRYYAVGTGGVEGDGTNPSSDRVIPLLVSDDLFHWRSLGGALIESDVTRGNEIWAPEVGQGSNGAFYLYYSVGPDHQLRVARSETPGGPYADCGVWLTSTERGIPFAIDATVFRDDDGQQYLFYARDYEDTDDGHHAGTAIAVDRLATMTQLAGEERPALRARNEWTLFKAQRDVRGTVYDWHTIEGPQVRKRNGRYYLFFSGAWWETESYGVDWAVADTATGPYFDEATDKPRLLSTALTGLRGPGHNSVVTDPNGDDYLVYHAWNAEHTKRQMYIDRLVWTEEGPHREPLQ
ncbi:MAG: family 43 glycosylhydrolase [Fibrella sp.]|nr:family 43 glycosylhydrolase [Armatimonadota bacterium]